MNLYTKIKNRLRGNKKYKKRIARLEKNSNFQIDEIDGSKVVKVNDLILGHIFDGDGVLIIEEIFSNGEYHFNIEEPVVVIDIGMNIGMASLYFASMENVVKVYGYEPFKPTFDHAMFNFKINEKYSNKIFPSNYGLGSREKELSFDYNTKAPGQMSTVKLFENGSPISNQMTKKETVLIKDAAKEILSITQQHKDQKIVLKCDTEGSEIEIFEQLEKNKLLINFELIMLEYHFSYDLAVEKILKRNGFVFFKQRTVSSSNGDFGLIRAVKKR